MYIEDVNKKSNHSGTFNLYRKEITMKRKKLLFVSLLSMLLLVPCFKLKAEEEIIPAAAAYQCTKCGSHQVEWYKHYYTDWEDYTLNGKCPDGKAGYVHVIQRKYYNYFLSCSACKANFKDGITRFDQREICKKRS